MRFPIIKVRDKLTGRVHIVGSDTHDTLYIGNDGGIHYYNLQNGEGTGRNGDYEFIGVDDEYALGPEIEFVRVEPDNSGIIAEIKNLLESWDFRAIASELESGYDQGVLLELVELCEKLTGAKSPRVNWLDQKDANAAKVKRVRDLWGHPMAAGAYRAGIRDTLSALGITIPGINAPEGDGNDA